MYMHDLRFLGAGRYEPHTEAGGGVALPPPPPPPLIALGHNRCTLQAS